MTFAKKTIEVTIGLGQGALGNEPDQKVVTLKGYRITVDMEAYYGDSMGKVLCRIYGIPQSLMNQLSTNGITPSVYRMSSKVSISVGDSGEVLQTVFNGVIDTCIPDFADFPNVCLTISAFSAYDIALTPVGATSFKGPQSVENILQSVISTVNGATPGQSLSLVNHGVDVTLTDAYLPGTGLTQIKAVARAARFNYRIDSTGSGGVSSNTLVIWPNGGNVISDEIIHLSPSTGLIGYPTVSSNTISLKTLFVNARFGTQIKVSGSEIPTANGNWICLNVTHDLECERPGGGWFTNIVAAYQAS